MNPHSAQLKAFLASPRYFSPGVRAQVGAIVNHLEDKTPAQRAAVLDKTSPEHAALLAHLSKKLGRSVERLDMEMLKLVKDLTL
jgi:hypothetical protein